MSELLSQGLYITAIGMGLVFVIILLLWGGMALLVRLTAERKKKVAPEMEETWVAPAAETDEPDLHGARARAAAVAVAYALSASTQPAGMARQAAALDALTPWQAARRISQLQNSTTRGRSR